MPDPLKFPATPPPGGHILGQPFTLNSVWIPVNVTMTCNCVAGNAPMEIVGSVSVPCPACQKSYNAAFNPVLNKLEFSIAVPDAKVPS